MLEKIIGKLSKGLAFGLLFSQSACGEPEPCYQPKPEIILGRAEQIVLQEEDQQYGGCWGRWCYFKIVGDGAWPNVEPKLDFSALELGLRVDYTKPTDTWIGFFHLFKEREFKVGEPVCADLFGYEGIIFEARGNGSVAIDLTEGKTKIFGEIYRIAVYSPEEWREFKMPFTEFGLRDDWHHPTLESKYDDQCLDLTTVRALGFELFCRYGGFNCGERFFEVRNLGFY